MTDNKAYVSAFVARNRHLITDSSEALLAFLDGPNKLCSAMTLSPEAASIGERDYDSLMPSFVNELSSDVRRDLFDRKLLKNVDRQDSIFSFLQVCNETGLNKADVELIDVTDVSTWRARSPGHIVYRIDLSLQKCRRRTIYLKGFGTTEYGLLTGTFAGWEGRPNMHLYDEFAQKAANISGISRIRSKFCLESQDPNFVGFTLTEAVPGVHSEDLFNSGKMPEMKREYWPHLPTILKHLAVWHAFADLMGKADRRFLQIGDKYHRQTNYFIEPDSLAIDVIDHEYLFSPAGLVAYELDNRYSEMTILATVPKNQMLSALSLYTQHYVDSWNALVSGHDYIDICRLASDVFGPKSIEVSFLEAAQQRNPKQAIQVLWNNIRHKTLEMELAALPD